MPEPTEDSAAPLPPGQKQRDELRVRHYGRVPRADPATWTVTVTLTDPDGSYRELGRVTAAELLDLPQQETGADFHCASGWSVRGLRWSGVPATWLLERFPPPAGTVGVLVYAQYGYAANVRLSDLERPTTLLATGLDGAPLSPDHGYPVRLVLPHLYSWKGPKWFRGWEYLLTPRRGFWEERGYHITGDPDGEQRYSYLE